MDENTRYRLTARGYFALCYTVDEVDARLEHILKQYGRNKLDENALRAAARERRAELREGLRQAS